MVDESRINQLKKQYESLNSKASWKYTENIMLKMGNEIQKRFPGVDFTLKARFKSKKSHQGKIDRFIRKGEDSEKKIYDDIGFCLIVNSVADDFDFEHALCEMSVEDRSKIGLEIDNEKSSMKIIEDKYIKAIERSNIDEKAKRIKDQIEKLTELETPDDELIEVLKDSLKTQEDLKKLSDELFKKLKEKSEKVVRIGNKYYTAADNKINEMMATHIMNKIISDKEFMKSLGLKVMLGRKKFHDGGKSGYYRAYHDAVESTTIPGWMLEVQALSYQNYITSKEGKAQHSKCEGKTRRLPRLGENPIQKEAFKQAILESAPKNLIYQTGTYKNGEQIKPGTVYKCSDVENMTYFYLEVLRDRPDLFKNIITDTTLFSDEHEIIEEDSER